MVKNIIPAFFCCIYEKGIVMSFLVIAFLSFETFGQHPVWDPPQRLGHMGRSVAMDSHSKLYPSGRVYEYNQAYLGDQALPVSEDNYAFIAKTDNTYALEWIKNMEGEFYISKSFLAVDSKDNLIMVCKFRSEIKIDSLELKFSEEEINILVAKFDPLGKLIWHQVIETGISNYFLEPMGLKVTHDDEIIIGGNSANSYTLFNSGTGEEVRGKEAQIFFASFNADGKFQWVRTYPENDFSFYLRSFTVDENKNLFFTGSMGTHAVFEDFTVDGKSLMGSIVFGKVNSDLKLEWVKAMGGASSFVYNQSGQDIAVDDHLGAVYLTGAFVGNTDFGGVTLDAGDNNIFLARYTLEGDLVWVKNMGSWSGVASLVEEGKALTVDNEGMVYLAGSIRATNWSFNGVPVETAGFNGSLSQHSFFAKYTAGGSLLWVTVAGPPEYDNHSVSQLLKYGNSSLIAVGTADSGSTFGEHALKPNDLLMAGYIGELREPDIKIFDVSLDYMTFRSDTLLVSYFDIFSNQAWEATTDKYWLTTDKLKGDGNEVLEVRVEANEHYEPRFGRLSLTAENGIERAIIVRQEKGNIITGLETEMTSKLNIYPNPVAETLFIGAADSFVSIHLYDVHGKKIKSYPPDTTQISMRGIKDGL